MKDEKIWDKKAFDFPRYDENNQEFQQKIVEILKEKNILNKKTSILDIGCGTGVYTLLLAKEAQKVLATDISSNMLEILKEDAWANNLNKIIETKHISWDKFKSKEKYDLVFASLSAAFHDNVDFERMVKYSNKYICFLDFIGTKGSNFEELLFKQFGIVPQFFNELGNLKEWLKSKNKKFETIPLNNLSTRLISKDIAIQKMKELLKLNNKVNLDDENILLLLKPLMLNDHVKYEFNMKLELLIFKV